MLKMDLEYNHGVLFVRLKGFLNRKTSYKINNYLNPVIDKHGIKYLVINCYFLKGIDCSGIDSLIRTKCLIKKNKGQIRVCELSGNLKYIFKNLKIRAIESELEGLNLMEESYE